MSNLQLNRWDRVNALLRHQRLLRCRLSMRCAHGMGAAQAGVAAVLRANGGSTLRLPDVAGRLKGLACIHVVRPGALD